MKITNFSFSECGCAVFTCEITKEEMDEGANFAENKVRQEAQRLATACFATVDAYVVPRPEHGGTSFHLSGKHRPACPRHCT